MFPQILFDNTVPKLSFSHYMGPKIYLYRTFCEEFFLKNIFIIRKHLGKQLIHFIIFRCIKLFSLLKLFIFFSVFFMTNGTKKKRWAPTQTICKHVIGIIGQQPDFRITPVKSGFNTVRLHQSQPAQPGVLCLQQRVEKISR